MSETSSSPKRWHKPDLVALGRREGTDVPSTIDLADDVRVVDLSDQSVRTVRKPQTR